MLEKKEKRILFENARLIFYAVLLVAGVLVCNLPFRFLCDYEGYSCVFCGMRHAIDYLLEWDFGNAVKSNPLICSVVVVVVDTCWILSKRFFCNET